MVGDVVSVGVPKDGGFSIALGDKESMAVA